MARASMPASKSVKTPAKLTFFHAATLHTLPLYRSPQRLSTLRLIEAKYTLRVEFSAIVEPT